MSGTRTLLGVRSKADTLPESPTSTRCCPEKSPETLAAARCPESGALGKAVERHTVKAVLTEAALQRLPAGDYRFCPDPACDVVHFVWVARTLRPPTSA
jgi:hypothetical protein